MSSADIRARRKIVQIRDKVCGADILKQFLIARILSRDGTKIQERFGTN